MQLTLFTLDGLLFALRWLHIFFAVVWIGHLYYFNFVQGAFMAEAEPAWKSGVLQKLLPRALWWFRIGAIWTWVTGATILAIKGHLSGGEMMSSYWVNIGTGGLLGTIMAANVIFVIWPKQQIVIKNAVDTAKGGAANAAAAPAAARALVASRTNTLLSIPMMFFMASASHLIYSVGPNSHVAIYWIVAILTAVGIEWNALFGKNGPMTTIKGVITSGFVLTAIYYAFIVFTM